jgi:hypothetical protein
MKRVCPSLDPIHNHPHGMFTIHSIFTDSKSKSKAKSRHRIQSTTRIKQNPKHN